MTRIGLAVPTSPHRSIRSSFPADATITGGCAWGLVSVIQTSSGVLLVTLVVSDHVLNRVNCHTYKSIGHVDSEGSGTSSYL